MPVVFSIRFCGFRPFRDGASHQFLPHNFFIFSRDELYIQASQYDNPNSPSALFLGWSTGGKFHSRTLLRLTSLMSLAQPCVIFSAIVRLRCNVFKCHSISGPQSAARVCVRECVSPCQISPYMGISITRVPFMHVPNRTCRSCQNDGSRDREPRKCVVIFRREP